MKKIGQFFACFLPLIGMFAVEVVVQLIAMLCLLIISFARAGEHYAVYYSYLTSIPNMLMIITICSQLVAFIVGIVIFKAVFKEKKMFGTPSKIGLKGIIFIPILFVGCEVFTGCLLTVAAGFFPDVMNEYAEMIESSGLADLTVFSAIATLILAPLLEEIIFRGMTLKLAGRFTKKFWIANLIQATMFGIAHMNLIQGLYAGILGLLLGYVCKKYNSLLASMLGHLAFNFTGTFLVTFFFGTEENPTFERFIILLAGSLACMIAMLIAIAKTNKEEKTVTVYEQNN